MANIADVKNAVAKQEDRKPSVISSLESLLKAPTMKLKFDEMLGKKSAGFMSSILSAVNTNSQLRLCDPMSVISSAAVAASLDLPINQSLGFAHIVPYSGKAQFQMGWKGFVQLAMRSGQYKSMNCSEVYEDELDNYNHITGEIKFKSLQEWKQREANQKEKIIGYVAFFKLINGFEMYLYMSRAQVEAHGRKYSASFNSDKGNWKLRFDSMAKKTVIKLLLSKFGILSIEMQKAITSDQAIFTTEGTPEYIDAKQISFDDVKSDSVSVSENEIVPNTVTPETLTTQVTTTPEKKEG